MVPRRHFLYILLSLAVALGSLSLTTISQTWWLTTLSVVSSLVAAALIVRYLRHIIVERKKQTPSYRASRLAAFAVIAPILVLIAASLWIARNRAFAMLHPKRSAIKASPQANGIQSYKNVQFSTPDGLRLQGWYIPTKNGATIIFVHGLGGNRGQLVADAGNLTQLGYGALLYDARNSGLSEGDLTTFGLLEVNDVRGAITFISAQPGADPDRIALFGHSMGGATVIMAAAQIPKVRAVVAQSTFTSLQENIRDGLHRFVGLPSFPFAPLVVFWGERQSGIDIHQVRPIDQIAAISPRPILLVHGALDKTIPVENAYHLFQAAQEPKQLYILPTANHCCLPQNGGDDYMQKISGFLRDSLAP